MSIKTKRCFITSDVALVFTKYPDNFELKVFGYASDFAIFDQLDITNVRKFFIGIKKLFMGEPKPSMKYFENIDFDDYASVIAGCITQKNGNIIFTINDITGDKFNYTLYEGEFTMIIEDIDGIITWLEKYCCNDPD